MNGSRRNHWTSGLVVALGVSAAAGFYAYAKRTSDLADPEFARKSNRPIPVRTVEVSQSQVDQVVGATAVTEGSTSWVVQVGSNTRYAVSDLIVKAVHAAEGDRVEKGQVLFELDTTPFTEELEEQQETVASAKATLDRTLLGIAVAARARRLEIESSEDELFYRKNDLDARTAEYNALVRLDAKHWANIIELNDAKSLFSATEYAHKEVPRRRTRALDAINLGKLQDAESEQIARQQYQTALNDLAQLRRDLERCRVRTPIDGLIDSLPLVPGSTIAPNVLLSTVRKVDPIHVRMDYPQERIDEVYVGQPAEVVLDSHPKETFHGKVFRISNQVNPALRVLPVIVRLDNPQWRIKPGITGFVRLHASRQAMTVPSAAVIEGTSKAMVFRVEGGRARIRTIRTGFVLQNGTVEVLEGLSPGDEIVLYHNFYPNADRLVKAKGLLQDGDPVNTAWRRWARRD